MAYIFRFGMGLLTTLTIVSHAEVTAPPGRALISKIVDRYQQDARSRFGEDIQLIFHDENILQALGGRNREGQLVIEVYGGVLNLTDQQAMIYFVCHELGHILGHVSLGEALKPGETASFNPLDNVEGEADYFGGSCVRDTLTTQGAEAETLSVIKRALEIVDGKKIDESHLDEMPPFDGINSHYPENGCRYLSARAGAQNLPRPLCWYNPDKFFQF